MKIIIFKQENGNAAVMVPTAEYLQDHTIEECAASVPAGTEFHIIEEEDLPQEHDDFFNAWEVDNCKIRICHIKSQAITKERLRADRTPLMLAQDIAFQRALETGADTASIVTEKQRLRDITKLADKATTLDALKALKV